MMSMLMLLMSMMSMLLMSMMLCYCLQSMASRGKAAFGVIGCALIDCCPMHCDFRGHYCYCLHVVLDCRGADRDVMLHHFHGSESESACVHCHHLVRYRHIAVLLLDLPLLYESHWEQRATTTVQQLHVMGEQQPEQPEQPE
jgi:hypothetical protein